MASALSPVIGCDRSHTPSALSAKTVYKLQSDFCLQHRHTCFGNTAQHAQLHLALTEQGALSKRMRAMLIRSCSKAGMLACR